MLPAVFNQQLQQYVDSLSILLTDLSVCRSLQQRLQLLVSPMLKVLLSPLEKQHILNHPKHQAAHRRHQHTTNLIKLVTVDNNEKKLPFFYTRLLVLLTRVFHFDLLNFL